MKKVQKILITGGTRGIGLATTEKFLDKRYDIFVLAKNFSKFSLKNNPNIHQLKFDLSDVGGIKKLPKIVGNIDILINNAAVFKALTYEKYTQKAKEETLKVNIEAPVELINVFSKGMIKNGHGRIVNVASIAGEIGHSDIWYGATKAALINITKSYSKSLGPKRVIINAVAPGPVKTDMFSAIPKKRREQLKQATITGKHAQPEDVSETIYWLATSAPSHINGFCIDINNGAYPR